MCGRARKPCARAEIDHQEACGAGSENRYRLRGSDGIVIAHRRGREIIMTSYGARVKPGGVLVLA